MALKGRKRDVMELVTSRAVLSRKERWRSDDRLELDDPHSCHGCARACRHDGRELILARHYADRRRKCSRTLQPRRTCFTPARARRLAWPTWRRFSRIGPLLAELEEESLTPPARALIAKVAAIDRIRADLLMLVLEVLQHPNQFSILERDGELFVVASPQWQLCSRPYSIGRNAGVQKGAPLASDLRAFGGETACRKELSAAIPV